MIEEFRYSGFRYKFNTFFFPFIGIVIMCSILIMLGIKLVEFCIVLSYQGEFVECKEAIVPMLAGIVVAIFIILIALSVHAQLPSIFIRDTGFRIQCFIYTSPWLNWETIEKIKTPYPFAPIKVYAIQVTGIGLLFLLIGITQRLSGRGFLLSERIERFDRLNAILLEKRPDLFV